MPLDLLQRLDRAAKALIPALLTFLLIVAMLAPLRAAEIAPVTPALALTAVYYWTVFRAELMPAWLAFLLGLVKDLLTGAPLGVGVLELVAMHSFVSSQRRIFVNPSFAMLWVIFALFAAGSLLLSWLLGSLLLGQWLDPRLLLLHYLLTAGSYPLMAWFFGRTQQLIL